MWMRLGGYGDLVVREREEERKKEAGGIPKRGEEERSRVITVRLLCV